MDIADNRRKHTGRFFGEPCCLGTVHHVLTGASSYALWAVAARNMASLSVNLGIRRFRATAFDRNNMYPSANPAAAGANLPLDGCSRVGASVPQTFHHPVSRYVSGLCRARAFLGRRAYTRPTR